MYSNGKSQCFRWSFSLLDFEMMAGHSLVMGGAMCLYEVCVDPLGVGGHELLKETRIRLGNHYKPVKFILDSTTKKTTPNSYI